ncbi:MAG: hypothetical protein LBJ75_03535, partial [Puniceicoccales bacterium]|nr:hypothetical protein [Puniceicoccales bacterium]
MGSVQIFPDNSYAAFVGMQADLVWPWETGGSLPMFVGTNIFDEPEIRTRFFAGFVGNDHGMGGRMLCDGE